MESFIQDVRYAVRMLFKSLGFTLVAVLTLALGIGANTAMFSVLNAVLFQPIPFLDSSHVMVVSQKMENGTTNLFTTADYLAWKEQSTDLADMGAFVGHTYNFSGEPLAERLAGSQVSREVFPVVGIEPLLGRTFTPDEDRPGGPAVVILSNTLWKTRFQGDRNILGKTITLDGTTAAIVGVMPPGFHLFNQLELLWTPLQLPPTAEGASNVHWLTALARLHPDSTEQQTTVRLDSIAERIHRERSTDDAGFGVTIVDVRQYLSGNLKPLLALLTGAAGLVLLIACSNVANLLLARGNGRWRELSIRAALGARRTRILRQLLTESCLLALIGGAAGVALAYLALPAVLATQTANLLGVSAVSVDRAVLLTSFLVSVTAGLLFGVMPALNASSIESYEGLKEGERGTSARLGRYRIGLVIGETALASLLLIAAGLAVKSMWLLIAVPPGFNPQDVYTFQISAPAHLKGVEIPVFYQTVLERIAALPGVQKAVITRDLPMAGVDPSMPIAIDGQAPKVTPGQVVTRFRTVSPGYFKGMEIHLLQGREFNSSDNASSMPVVVVSQSLAQRYWPNEDPVGKRVKPQISGAPWYTVVGVAADVRHWTADVTDFEPTAYYPFQQVPQSVMGITLGNHMTFAVRSGQIDSGMLAALQNAVALVDKTVPVYNVKTMASIVSDASTVQRLNMSLLAIFAFLALTLASIGVYGVIANSVVQRTREIGIRIALGAQTGDVLRMIVLQGMQLAVAGIVLGLIGAALLSKVLSAYVYGISARDVTIFTAVPAILLSTILLACFVPARRAAKVEPVVALRYE